jgi:histidinol-phosphatase (PHP family)
MSLPADYHTHTPLCRHATGEPTELAAQAVRLGLSEIGFSDHSPMPRDDFDNWRMNATDLDEYVAAVEQARRDHPNLSIKLALEVDYLPGYEDWIRDLAARHPWDYFIGSVHYVGTDWAIDDPSSLSRWDHADPDAVWKAYVELLVQAAESGLFDIIGHIDLPKKFGFRPHLDPLPLYDRFLAVAKRCDVAIEINTAGLRKECREMYPARSILDLAAGRGVALTFGSDAHAPEEVGANLVEAVDLARAAGFTRTRRFCSRRVTDLPLRGDEG